MEGHKATWHDEINLRSISPGEVDAGMMSFSDADHVREDGLDGSYHELWERLPDSVGPSWGFRLTGQPQARAGDAPFSLQE